MMFGFGIISLIVYLTISRTTKIIYLLMASITGGLYLLTRHNS